MGPAPAKRAAGRWAARSRLGDGRPRPSGRGPVGGWAGGEIRAQGRVVRVGGRPTGDDGGSRPGVKGAPSSRRCAMAYGHPGLPSLHRYCLLRGRPPEPGPGTADRLARARPRPQAGEWLRGAVSPGWARPRLSGRQMVGDAQSAREGAGPGLAAVGWWVVRGRLGMGPTSSAAAGRWGQTARQVRDGPGPGQATAGWWWRAVASGWARPGLGGCRVVGGCRVRQAGRGLAPAVRPSGRSGRGVATSGAMRSPPSLNPVRFAGVYGLLAGPLGRLVSSHLGLGVVSAQQTAVGRRAGARNPRTRCVSCPIGRAEVTDESAATPGAQVGPRSPGPPDTHLHQRDGADGQGGPKAIAQRRDRRERP